ncbi:MAG: DUF427 domain-containing protein [Hyphomicrobium aestuarii]|nr:DUF427 domain-containing protein [Hyphomicrobium aestuarii]
MRAIWNGRTIAESDQTIVVEGNHYFPPQSVDSAALKDNSKTSVCHWKGTARYFDVLSGDDVNSAAAWSYPSPSADARNIAGYIAFWKGVTVEP